MTRKTLGTTALPDKVQVAIQKLGMDIKLARQRRIMTQEVLAKNMFVTAKTVRRVEAGDPGVSLGVYASALFVLGFADRLAQIAAPEADQFANWQQRHNMPKRVRQKKDKDDRLDF